MEVRIEDLPGYELPQGCFVSVRVGDVLKQRKFEPASCCYSFPALDRRRGAKIDVYRLVGTCSTMVEPESSTNAEVTVKSTESGVPDLRLRFRSHAREAGLKDAKEQRQEQAKGAKDVAMTYLAEHKVEERLAEAIRALLKQQPADPVEFICNHLHGGAATKTAASAMIAIPVVKPVEPVVEQIPRSTPTHSVPHVKVAMRLEGLSASSASSLAQRIEVERLVSKAFMKLGPDLLGEYLPLAANVSYVPRPGGMSVEEQNQLASEGFLFDAPDPQGCGVFVLSSRQASVWINEGPHVQIVVRELGSQSKAVSTLRLLDAKLREALKQDGHNFVSAPVAFGRRLHGFGEPMAMSVHERAEMERVITKVLSELSSSLQGEYFPMPGSMSYAPKPGGMDKYEEIMLLNKGVCILAGEDVIGRGVFLSLNGTLLCLNPASEDQHLVFLPGSNGSEAKLIESALADGLRKLGQKLV